MITHEIQPNLRLFELSQITSSVFFLAPAELTGSPLLPSSLRIWREKLGAASPPQVACFQVSLFEHGTERGPRGLALDNATFHQYRRGTVVDTDRNREEQHRESLRLIKTYTLSVLCREFTQNPYVSLNFHSLLTLFKSLSREDVQSKASSWGREAERSRVEPREEGERGGVAVSS